MKQNLGDYLILNYFNTVSTKRLKLYIKYLTKIRKERKNKNVKRRDNNNRVVDSVAVSR